MIKLEPIGNNTDCFEGCEVIQQLEDQAHVADYEILEGERSKEISGHCPYDMCADCKVKITKTLNS